jgi:hypothetical protein
MRSECREPGEKAMMGKKFVFAFNKKIVWKKPAFFTWLFIWFVPAFLLGSRHLGCD